MPVVMSGAKFFDKHFDKQIRAAKNRIEHVGLLVKQGFTEGCEGCRKQAGVARETTLNHVESGSWKTCTRTVQTSEIV